MTSRTEIPAVRPNLPLLLLMVREQVRAHFQPHFRQQGITEQQWRILRRLYEWGGAGVIEIADACGISRPSIVVIIARTEEQGLVIRHEVPEDKRRSNIVLSERGREIVETLKPIFGDIYRDLEKSLGKRRVDRLYAVLEDMRMRLERIKPEP